MSHSLEMATHRQGGGTEKLTGGTEKRTFKNRDRHTQGHFGYLIIDVSVDIKGPVSGFVGCQRWTAEFKGIT